MLGSALASFLSRTNSAAVISPICDTGLRMLKQDALSFANFGRQLQKAVTPSSCKSAMWLSVLLNDRIERTNCVLLSKFNRFLTLLLPRRSLGLERTFPNTFTFGLIVRIMLVITLHHPNCLWWLQIKITIFGELVTFHFSV